MQISGRLGLEQDCLHRHPRRHGHGTSGTRMARGPRLLQLDLLLGQIVGASCLKSGPILLELIERRANVERFERL